MATPTATIYIPYHAFDDLILRGLRAAQPSSPTVGTLYFVTDEGIVERFNGTIWESYGGSGGSGMIPMTTGAEPLEIMSNGAGSVLMVGFSE